MQTTLAPAPSAVRTTRVPSPCSLAVPPSRAHHSCPVAVLHSCAFAVGRDVPIAPSPCAAWHRASSSCAFAVGRDVPIAPPRHRRGARLRTSRRRGPHSLPARAAAPHTPSRLGRRASLPVVAENSQSGTSSIARLRIHRRQEDFPLLYPFPKCPARRNRCRRTKQKGRAQAAGRILRVYSSLSLATLATPSRRAKERPEKANAVFPHAASVGNCPDFRTSNANLHPPSSPAFRTILPDTRRSALDFARFLLFFRQMQF